MCVSRKIIKRFYYLRIFLNVNVNSGLVMEWSKYLPTIRNFSRLSRKTLNTRVSRSTKERELGMSMFFSLQEFFVVYKQGADTGIYQIQCEFN